MRATRSRSGRVFGITRNVNPRLRASVGARPSRNPYEALRTVGLPTRGGIDAYRQFIRRILQAA